MTGDCGTDGPRGRGDGVDRAASKNIIRRWSCRHGRAYSGRWFSNASPAHSGGAVALTMDAGARVTVSFEGTGIRWIGYRDEWSGVARIYVDGELRSTVDAYLAPSHAQATIYALGDLPPGPHTLAIEATGTRNESAKGSWIWLDSFDIVR